MREIQKTGGNTQFPVEAPDTLLPFLLAHVKGKSRNTVKGLLARRQVRVGGKIVTQFDHPLRPGQTVTLLPPADQRPPRPPFPILYEDSDLIAVNKPAGLLTVATDRERERTAYRMLTDYLSTPGGEKPLYVVHRLDRDTSGVVLFAKNEEMKRVLQDDWDALVEARVYLAVVEGAPPERRGTVRSFLRETTTHLVYSAGPGGSGKEAVTRYEILDSAEGRSLLRVELDTGRKNQIRVHMKDLGCPVEGDKKYGSGGGSMGRLGLHACTLALTDPRTGEKLALTAPAPKEFKRLFPDLPG